MIKSTGEDLLKITDENVGVAQLLEGPGLPPKSMPMIKSAWICIK